MIPIEKLSLIEAEAAAPGTWLLCPTRYTEGPAFRCVVEGRASAIVIGGDPQRRFKVYGAKGDGAWLLAEGAQVSVDTALIASPFQGDIPPGSICIVGGEVCLSARYNHGEIYISLRTGEPVNCNYDRFVAFTHWTLSVPGLGDDRVEIFRAGSSAAAGDAAATN